jgi:hypothetical protein
MSLKKKKNYLYSGNAFFVVYITVLFSKVKQGIFLKFLKKTVPLKKNNVNFLKTCPLRGLCTIKMGKLPDNVPVNLLSLKLCLTIQYVLHRFIILLVQTPW